MARRAAQEYTDEQIEAALARLKLNGGHLRATARETGVSMGVLERWQRKAYVASLETRLGELMPYSAKPPPEVPATADPRVVDWAAKWGAAQSLALEKVMEQLPSVDDPKVAMQMAVMASNAYLDHAVGRRTAGGSQQVSIHNNPQVLNVAAQMEPELRREILMRTAASIAPSLDRGQRDGN